MPPPGGPRKASSHAGGEGAAHNRVRGTRRGEGGPTGSRSRGLGTSSTGGALGGTTIWLMENLSLYVLPDLVDIIP